MRYSPILFLAMLLHLSGNSQQDTNTVIKLNKQTLACVNNGTNDSILVYGQKAKLLSESLHYTRGIATALANMSGYYTNLGQYNSSIEFLNKALDISENIKDQKLIGGCYNSLGRVYIKMANYPVALDYFFKSLKIRESLQDNKGVMYAENNIGSIYVYLEDIPKAMMHYNKMLSIARQSNDESMEALALANISNIYGITGDFKKALDTEFETLKLYEASKNEVNIPLVLNNIGSAYQKYAESVGTQRTRDSLAGLAIEYDLKALRLSEQAENVESVLFSYNNLTAAYMVLKKWPDALIYSKKASTLAKELEALIELKEAERNQYNIYKALHDPVNALLHYENYITARDSIQNEENIEKNVSSALNYEFDKKAAATKFENDKIIYKLEADNKLQRQLRLFLILAIALACVLLFFVKRAYDSKKRLALFLEAEDRRKEILLQEVHHRINNNLQIISGLLTLQANSADDPRLHGYLIQSQNRIQSLSALHELLYDTNSPLEIDMRDYINKVLDFHRDISGAFENLTIEADIEPVKFPTKLAVPIALIVNELVTNAIKYAFKESNEGIITVRLSRAEDAQWHLLVADNGKGMPAEEAKRKDSLGLRLVQLMARQLGAVMTSKNEHGAVFSIVFNMTNNK